MKNEIKTVLAVWLFLLALPVMFIIAIFDIVRTAIWIIRGEPCPFCGYSLRDVRLSGYHDGLYYKRCPKCGGVVVGAWG